jgi:hypothetical protein
MKIDTIIDSYIDFKECGKWGSFKSDNGKLLKEEKMFTRTVKVRRADGVVALETEWITDEDMKKEIEERK